MPVRDTNHHRPKNASGGNAIMEFALVMAFLVAMLAGAFTMGITVARGIQASNVTRDALVLLVRSITDPDSGFDLSQTQNQRIIVRAAQNFNMASDASYDPSSTGGGVVILSKVILVGPNTCAMGIVPAPSGVPNTTAPNYGWTTGNCPNYGSYVFAYRIVIGNGTRWSSALGNPGTGTVLSNGTISSTNIASTSSDQVGNFLGVTGMTSLSLDNYALVSELYADISSLNFFSILKNPTLYARNIS
jgi:hypothetical protein